MKKLFLKTLLTALVLLTGGVSSAWAATPTLKNTLEVAGYKAKAYYDFTTNTPAVLPTVEPNNTNLTYRSGYGLHNYGSGSRSASVNIPVSVGDLVVFETYIYNNNASGAVTINVGTLNASLSSSTGFVCYSDHSWTQTVVRTENGQPATNGNGTEMWQATGNYTQTVSDLPSGLYKVSIQAFYRNGGADECVARYNTGYNTVLAYLDANGSKAQVKSWAEDKGEGNDPNSMDQAKAKFGDGKYVSETYAYVGEDSLLNLTVYNPAFIGNGWFIVGNVKYAKVDNKILAGDANLSGDVTVGDAVLTVSFALEREKPTEDQKKAADINNSNTITIADAVGIVNIALSVEPEEPAAARGSETVVNYLTQDGTEIGLVNTTEFAGFQMDVTLCDGAMLSGVKLADRARNLTLTYSQLSADTWRIVALSLDGSVISGNDGSLISLDIMGQGGASVSHVEFADRAANAYELGFITPTGISTLYNNKVEGEVYTVSGTRTDSMKKGVNVVRQADGSVSKVLVK